LFVAFLQQRTIPDVKAVMVYARAPASDFDDWAVDGWESKNLIPLMKKVLEYVVCRVVKLKLLLT
jgi:hypothetical protein